MISAPGKPSIHLGILLRASRSRMLAKITIASVKPIAALKPLTTDSIRLYPCREFNSATPSTAQLVVISGQVYAQSLIQGMAQLFQRQLHDLHQRGDYQNESEVCMNPR